MRGGLHAIYIVYCDIIQNIIYIGASYCLIFRWRGLTTKQITLIVIFLVDSLSTYSGKLNRIMCSPISCC